MQQDTYESLRQEFLAIVNNSTPYENENGNRKNEEYAEYITKRKKYVYDEIVLTDSSQEALQRLDVVVELCTSKSQHDLWTYIRTMTASIKSNRNPGRNLRFLVKDKTTDKYIGVLALGSDILYCQPRETAIGWSNERRMRKLVNVANIWTCVGVQPLAYNWNVGKLLASLCFSKEVIMAFEEKYKDPIACITTFSINGKSVQYDRLPNLKYVGLTKGFGTTKIPDNLYLRAREYLRMNDVDNAQRPGKLDGMRKICSALNLPLTLLNHGHPRGVYVGFTSNTSKQFLCGHAEANELEVHYKTTKEIVDWWKTRWAYRRLTHLQANGCVKKPDAVETDVVDGFLTNHGIPPHMQLSIDYIAGLIDGDGTIAAHKEDIRMEITQCDPRPLLMLQRQFGGHIRLVEAKTESRRRQFHYSMRAHQCKPLLTALKDRLYLKRKRATVALESLDMKSTNVCIEDIRAKLSELRNLQSKLDDVDVAAAVSSMSIEYIAGLFDAEGCLSSGEKGKYIRSQLSITQRSSEDILDAVQCVVGYGTLTKDRFMLYATKDILMFIEEIGPHIVVKRSQLDAYVQMTQTCDIDNKKKWMKKIADAKHVEWEVDADTLAKANAVGHIITNKMSRNLKDTTNEVKMNAFKKRQCERMVGTKRGEQSLQHRVNLAVSIMNAKPAEVTDNQIDDIRTRISTGQSCASICRETGLSRHAVEKVKNGVFVKTDEVTEDFIKNRLAQRAESKRRRADLPLSVRKEEATRKTILGKRRWTLDAVVRLVQHMHNHPHLSINEASRCSMEIAGCELSTHQVKYIINGVTKFFEDEFPCNGVGYDEFRAMLRI